MRTFFAIDQRCSIRLTTFKSLLELSLSRRRYEVLRLEAERFSCPRSNLPLMIEEAHREGEKIMGRYTDAVLCVVVFGFKTSYVGSPESSAPFDYALLLRRDGSCMHKLLNPPINSSGANIYWASSPQLQPQLTETLLEVAAIEQFPLT